MADIEEKDIFSITDIEALNASLADLNTRFSYHNHDGRNSLELDVNANARRIRLSTLNQLSDKSDGNVTVSSGTTTLTRDMFYDHLVVENGAIIDTASFRIFGDIIEIRGGGIVKNNGGDGGAGTAGGAPTAGSGGTAGTQVGAGSLPQGSVGEAGGAGSVGSGDDGTAGTAGDNVTKSLGAAGSGGGGGGRGGRNYGGDNNGGAGGNGGSQSGVVFNVPRSFVSAYTLIDGQPSVTALGGSAGSGSGGGGGGGSGVASGTAGGGGGGGGSGASGGVVAIFAKQIINEGTIQATGGDGGAGGAGGAASGTDADGGGGGGGGAGGPGGVIILCYGDLSGPGTLDVSGGTGGTAGAAGAKTGGGEDGAAGSAGADGAAGSTFSIQISSL